MADNEPAPELVPEVGLAVRHLTYDYRLRDYTYVGPADVIVKRAEFDFVTHLGERWPINQVVWAEGFVLGSEHGMTRELLVPANHPAVQRKEADRG